MDRGHQSYRAGSTAVSRRGLLRAGGVGLGATALSARRLHAQTATELTFAFAPDASGSLDNLIAAFNQEYEGSIRVNFRAMPEETDAFRAELETAFRGGNADIDVFGADVIWTAQFATERWVQDLSRRFYQDFAPELFLQAALDSTIYRNRVWAVPWFSAAGLLYYRRDLLEASGFTAPPETWEDLASQALQVSEDAGTPHGFVFQGGDYEGGVTNALEYIWSAGGRVMTVRGSQLSEFGMSAIEPNVVMVDSAASARGLDIARSMVERGVAPAEVASFNEQDAIDRFLAGDAVFMRNWPFAYGLIDGEQSQLSREQIGIAPIPTATPGGRHYSCLGGWNLMINAATPNVDAAWTFARFASSAQAQRQRAIEGGYMPTRRALYQDEQVGEQVPIVAQAADIFEETRNRPASPFYPEVSERIADVFNRVLQGELDGAAAVTRLQAELTAVVHRLAR